VNAPRERGAASILITLEDGAIEVIHGEDHVLLGRKQNTVEGDWDKLWELLTDELGVERLFGDSL
jgi:hypothetical protein